MSEQLRGVFLHNIFPLPGWGGGKMGLAGWKGFIDWARALDYNACAIHLLPQVRTDDPDWTLPEARRLYHSLIRARPKFEAGHIYYEADPLMNTPEVRRQHEIRREAVKYAASVGLQPHVWLFVALGSPTFTDEHPELLASHASDFCQEGMALSPRHPEAMEHLLDLWGHVVDSYPEAAGFYLWHADPGVGDTQEIIDDPELFVGLIMKFYEMIRSKRPDAVVTLAGWGIIDEMLPVLAKMLPKDIIIAEPPLIHGMARDPEDHVKRIRTWINEGFRVQQWVEIQENPTIMQPAVYPKRIENTMRLAQQEGVNDFMGCSSFYTYVFSPHFYIVSQLAQHKDKTAEQATREYLGSALGEEALDDAMEWAEAMEVVWTKLFTKTHLDSGFNWPWHIVFGGSLFPQKLMREPVPGELVEDVNAAVAAGEKALEACRRMAKKTWPFRSLDTNIILVSTELLFQRAQFRQAKLPVLEAIREGDLSAAVNAFKELTRLANLMVETAACAPNTQMLNTHWAKLALLPERVNAVKHHLSELVERKEIRGIFTV